MRVYLEQDNVITSLGFTTDENFAAMEAGVSGIGMCDDKRLSENPFPVSLVDKLQLDDEFSTISTDEYTPFEKLFLLSTQKALSASRVNPSDSRTLFILSTTKGNVDLLNKVRQRNQLYLWHSAELLQNHFKNPNKVVVISNACVSGITAMLTGMRLIKNGDYDHVVVTGGDVVSKFIVSGFQSFLSLSPRPCRPFDRDRDGLTLGEGAATIILTNKKTENSPAVELVTGATSNDANHISGPSRTGEGLFIALTKTLKGVDELPGFISAHGTATPYNDDMESIAFNRAGLQQIPVNSIKGFIGHTLGAAGIIESVIGARSLRRNKVLKTLGLHQQGLAQPIFTVTENLNIPLKSFVKTASGFGGSNATALFVKHE